MAKRTKADHDRLRGIMKEVQQGELKRGPGGKVKDPKQAIAIALHDAGASDDESFARKRQRRRTSKAKQKRRGRRNQRRGATQRTAKGVKRTARRPGRGRVSRRA
jgi:hypothetical protein